MPWAAPHRPSIQLGLLGPALRAAGHIVDCFHYYVELCRFLSPQLCLEVSERPRLGDWLFSFVYDPERLRVPNYEEFRAAIGPHMIDPAVATWDDARRIVEACSRLVDATVGQLIAGRYDVVGFSTMFDQTVASLCVAREIKRLRPETVIVMGGANADGAQGQALQRAFEFIDIVLAGEADRTLPRLIDALTSCTEAVERIPGASVRHGSEIRVGPSAEPVTDLDATPVPDYDPYFRQLESVEPARTLPIVLTMETSRGCWFGRCLFCGLNREAIAFRSKSPARVHEELHGLVQRYGILSVCMVDNIIDHRYFRTTLPVLADARREGRFDYSLFFELKANVRREDVRQLAESGVSIVQPGIESFVAQTLQLMHKGATVHHNIQVLKWCQEFGIRPYYNVLYGLPGQDAAALEAEVEMARALTHLEPPGALLPLRLQRFSPYFVAPERYGLRNVRPDPCYAAIYPPELELDQFAYDFIHDPTRDAVAEEEFAAASGRLHDAVRDWRKGWTLGRLSYSCGPGFVKIVDRRMGEPRHIVLRGSAAALAAECEGSAVIAGVRERLAERGHALDDNAIDTLVRERLLHVESGRALFLPIRERRPRLGTA